MTKTNNACSYSASHAKDLALAILRLRKRRSNTSVINRGGTFSRNALRALQSSLKLKTTSCFCIFSFIFLFITACNGTNDTPEVVFSAAPKPEVSPGDSSTEATPTPTPEPETFPENFYFGNDLSYVNEMEDCGAVYQDAGTQSDPYKIMADHGTNLVRVRLWHSPWWQTLVTQDPSIAAKRQFAYSNLDDVTETIRRSKAAGMKVMLGIHFSDFWADAGHQVTPREWKNLWGDDEALAEAVYNYVTTVLTHLDQQNLLPEIIKIGNESNAGLLTHEELSAEVNDNVLNIEPTGQTDTSDAHVAQMWNRAIEAVREFSQGKENPPLIALHVANSHRAVGFMDWLSRIGVTDFDIIGFSYYYAWHGFSIPSMAEEIEKLRTQHPDYAPMLIETGYPWDSENIDNLGNIITEADPNYRPLSKQNQLKYMVDISQAVADAGGIGVVFWEPAWVSTDCRTPWGQGSSHEHVAYFDHRDNNNFHYGGSWMEASYMSRAPQEGLETHFYLELDASIKLKGGVHIRGDFTENTTQPMLDMGNNVYHYFTKIPEGNEGTYHFLIGPLESDRETLTGECTREGERTYSRDKESAVFAHRWQSCDTFNPLKETLVRFNVDMSSTDHSLGAYITGEFNSWALQGMTNMGDGIYSLETTLCPGLSSPFYFLNDDDWQQRENVPTECALAWGSDRQFTLPEDQESFVINSIWQSCETFEYSNPPIPANTMTVRFHVDMNSSDYSQGAFITGEFNQWQIQAMNAMGDGIFGLEVTLPVGMTSPFYFLNDNDWDARETVPAECALAWDSDRQFTLPNDKEALEINLIWQACDEFSLR